MSGHLMRALLDDLDEEGLAHLADLLRPWLTPVLAEPEAGYLAPAEAARYLGISRKRVYDLRSSRALEPDGHDGRTPLFTRATLDAYVRGNGTCR